MTVPKVQCKNSQAKGTSLDNTLENILCTDEVNCGVQLWRNPSGKRTEADKKRDRSLFICFFCCLDPVLAGKKSFVRISMERHTKKFNKEDLK